MKKKKINQTKDKQAPVRRLTTGQKILLWVFLSLPMVGWTIYRHSPRGKRLSNEAPGKFKLESWMSAILGLILAVIIGSFAERNKTDTPKADSVTKQTLYADDPLCIGNENLQKLVGKPIPYERWGKWGSPETLPGTSNLVWVAYLSKGNITFQSLKKTDIIQRINFGRGLNFNTKSNESCDPKVQKPDILLTTAYPAGELIGAWICMEGLPRHRSVIYVDSGLKLHELFEDGTSSITNLTLKDGKYIYPNDFGEYYKITPSGGLEVYDSDGLINHIQFQKLR